MSRTTRPRTNPRTNPQRRFARPRRPLPPARPRRPATPSSPLARALADLQAAVDRGDRREAAHAIARVHAADPQISTPAWINAMRRALLDGRSAPLATLYLARAFLHPTTGRFLLVGDCGVLRGGARRSELSMLYAIARPTYPTERLRAGAEELLGPAREPFPEVIPYDPIATAGGLAQDGGESFITPDQWDGWMSPGAPSLNDARQQVERVERALPGLGEIFDPATTELLRHMARHLPDLQTREYATHDVGHGTGRGLTVKLSEFKTFMLRAVEETRADWMAFELTRQIEPHHLAEIVASNLLTRILVDAQRIGNRIDTDVTTTLLTLDRMLASGELYVTDDDRLALRSPDERGLCAAVRGAGHEGLILTLREMQLGSVEEVPALYQLAPRPGTRAIFERIVRRPDLSYRLR